MKNRYLLPALAAGIVAMIVACEQVPTGNGMVDNSTPLAHHRPDHAGGGGGNDGSDGGPKGGQPVIVTVTGGLVTGPNLTEIVEENKRRMILEMAGTPEDPTPDTVDLMLTATQAEAADAMTNPNNPVCEFRPPDAPLASKQLLVDGLVGQRIRGSVHVNHHDDRGSVGYNSTESGGPWLTLGINTQTGTIEDRAELDYLGTDPEDASSLRKFRFVPGTGIWRTLTEGVDLICWNQDEFTVEVDPDVP